LTERLPGRAPPSRRKVPIDIFERLTVRELVLVGCPHVVDRDIGLQNRTFPNLAFDDLGLIALRKCTGLFFYHESFDVTVCLVARIDDRDISGMPVANPTLMPVEDPRVPVTTSRGL